VATIQSRGDKDLIDRCINGDQAAWKELVMLYQPLVYSVAHLLLSQQNDDASDIFQQVWLELYQRLPDLRNVDALPAWLITVTRRRAFALLRSRRGFEPPDETIPDLSQQITRIEHEHMIQRALEQMPERCRRLIDLLYFDVTEPSYSQI
jgi:RNA polymerase sigma factor (sigma-70 family)